MAFLDDYNYTLTQSTNSDNWVDIVVKDTTKTSYANIPHTFTDGGVTYMVYSLFKCFKDCKNLKIAPTIESGPNKNYHKDLYYCFYGCTSLTEAVIPMGAINLVRTFFDCTALKNVTFANEISDNKSLYECFSGCTSLTTISNIPDGITNVEKTFYQCTALKTSPQLPNTITNMEECFRGCSSLTTITNIPSSVTNMYRAFYGCTSLRTMPTIPNGVLDMRYCFSNCTSLVNTTAIPSSVTSINYCFTACRSLETTPELPNNLTRISGCFSGCTALKTITNIPSNLVYIDYCFKDCSSLKTIPLLPNSITNMVYCFSGCSSLTTITNIPTSAVDLWYCFSHCISLKVTPSLPNTVTSINNCFYGCTSLTTVTNIPNNVVDMGECFRFCYLLQACPEIPNTVTDMSYCFSDCNSLLEVSNISSSVTNLRYCFYNCVLLSSDLTVPSTVNDIYRCFYNCQSITSVSINQLANEITDLTECFYNCMSLEAAPIVPNYVTDMTRCFYGCSKIEITPALPSTLTTLSQCFEGCTSLNMVFGNIPSSVTDMYRAFYGCTSLTKLPNVPNSVTDLRYCFQNCTVSKGTAIPSSVNKIDGCFKNCVNLEGYMAFDADPDTYSEVFYGTNREIRLITLDSAPNYNKAKTIAALYVNVEVDSNFSLYPPPVITSVECKRVDESGQTTEDRDGDWIYFHLTFKMFTGILPEGVPLTIPPKPEVVMHINDKLAYEDWIEGIETADTSSIVLDKVETPSNYYIVGFASGDYPDFYEQELRGWVKCVNPESAFSIKFQLIAQYGKTSELISKIVTSRFKVLDIAAPQYDPQNPQNDIYNKSKFAMGIASKASVPGGLVIGVPTRVQDYIIVDGSGTFGGSVYSSGSFYSKHLGVTKGVTPENTQYRTYEFHDKDGRRLAQTEVGIYSAADGDKLRMNLFVLNHVTGENSGYSGISILKTKGNTNAVSLVYDANSGYLTVPNRVNLKGVDYTSPYATHQMIGFKDGSDQYGSGIWIGGGGTTIIGGGESASWLMSTVSNPSGETMIVSNDGTVELWANCNDQNGNNVKKAILGTDGRLTISNNGLTANGSINFANNTWNPVGDDVYIGDHNVGGSLGVKGMNGKTKITLIERNTNEGCQIEAKSVGGSYSQCGRTPAFWGTKNTGSDTWAPAFGFPTKSNGSWTIGNYNDERLQMCWTPASSIGGTSNSGIQVVNVRNTGGTLALTSEINTYTLGATAGTYTSGATSVSANATKQISCSGTDPSGYTLSGMWQATTNQASSGVISQFNANTVWVRNISTQAGSFTATVRIRAVKI